MSFQTNPPSTVSRRQFLALTGSASALLLLGACAPVVAPAEQTTAQNAPAAVNPVDQPQHGGVLRFASSDVVNSLDPALWVSLADVQLGYTLYNTLTQRSDTGMPLYPELAESWAMNEDATVHTFHLRQGVTFHHGTAFTAKDVEYSISRLLDPALGSSVVTSLGDIDKLEVVDDFTIVFYLKAPNVTLPYTLGGPGLEIVPHDRTTEELTQEPAGTGPFVLAEHVPGERVVLRRNERYWEPERPYLDEVQLLAMPEAAAQVAALTSGTVDFLHQIGLESLAALEGAPDVQVLESRQGVMPIFAMRVDQKPFDDVRVRQAFKYAIDRAALQNVLLQGRGVIGNDQPIGPGTLFWADVPPLAYDVEKAKALLAEAGYGDGLEVTLVTAEIGGPRLTDAAVILQEMVKAVGITITLEKVPGDTFWTEQYMQVPFFVSWWPVFGDPDGLLPLAFSAEGPYNESGWSDPKVEELIVAARGAQDLEQRKTLYAEVQQIISTEGGVLVPYFSPLLQAIRSNVQGHTPRSRAVLQGIWLAQS